MVDIDALFNSMVMAMMFNATFNNI